MTQQTRAKKFLVLMLPAICLLVTCLITSALLAVTNEATAPVIEANLKKEAERLYKIVLPEADSFETQEVQMEGKSYQVQIAHKGSDTVGYVFTTQKNGYGGPVVCLTGINKEGVIEGVQILSSTETAGLGQNATKPEFLNQYKEKKAELHVVKSEASDEDEIQAISGATITSNAVTGSVNEALALFSHVNTAKGGN